MFDNVGRDLDEEAGKRTAASILITTIIFAGTIGLSIGYAAYTAAEIILDLEDDEDMIELSLEDESLDEAPPPPPPPPPPPADAGAEEEEEEDEEETPEVEEPPEDPPELDKEVKKEIQKQDKPKGQAGGVEGGEEGGVAGGVVGGVVGGVIGGQLGGVLTLHHSEVEVKKRVIPRYPAQAKPMNLGDQRCKVRVAIDEKGIPFQVKVEDCPKVFHQATKDALMKWRWYPAKAGKQKVKAQFVLVINYKMK